MQISDNIALMLPILLEKAYAKRDSGLHEMLNDPFLSNLVDDERWPIFLRKMGLMN
jgi:hypothetical protein